MDGGKQGSCHPLTKNPLSPYPLNSARSLKNNSSEIVARHGFDKLVLAGVMTETG